MGTRLGIDPRTVDRYLDVLEERYLLTFLPNLATEPRRQVRARSKIHCVDTAFAIESLRRADPQAMENPSAWGHLLESWVAGQVLPGLQFYDGVVQAYYWRDAKSGREVDLVLADSEGQCVAIEVKASATVDFRDVSGLMALDRSHRFDMGYVVYTGSEVVRLSDRIWALPLERLSC
jgi:predicted AAA+ superfamily ATPase